MPEANPLGVMPGATGTAPRVEGEGSRSMPWRGPVHSDNALLRALESVVEPAGLVAALWGAAWARQGRLDVSWVMLGVLAFALSFPGRPRLAQPAWRAGGGIVMDGLLQSLWLLAAAWLAGLGQAADWRVLLTALGLTPVLQLTGHALLRRLAVHLVRMQGPPLRAVVAGLNLQGRALADRLAASPDSGITLVGFFDDRQAQRHDRDDPAEGAGHAPARCLGRLSELAGQVKALRIQRIYLSLPMASQPRIRRLLDDLQDTTASVYFVPDLFITDLIQGRVDSVCGLPVISVCDTPFRGSAALVKRASDIILASMALVLLAPLMALLALAVRMESPGPAIFRQRRYGLDGQEITIYKFRSMTVCEDGHRIEQARRGDARVTRLGAWLRRTSLDELPQLVNVVQGRMSLVGPRPHAVVHNEFYRSQIRSYMVRHKVRPGITGWAQIHGLRGETATLDRMEARIRLDLDYLRHWSLRLDLYILVRTLLVAFRDAAAY